MPSRFHHIPFSPAKSPLFYGWAIVAVGTVGLVMTAPGQTNGFTLFVDSLMGALGLTREHFSWAYAAGTIGSALLLSSAGKLYDRVGARVLGPAACVGLGLAALWIALSDRIACGVTGLVGESAAVVVSFVVITIGIFAARFCGQGVLMMTCRTMMMQWFDRHRGLAAGISGTFTAPGFAGVMALMLWMDSGFGWRGAYVIMACVVGGGFALIALITFRTTPESCGLKPDGGAGVRRDRRVEPVHRQFTAYEARRAFSFWAFILPLVVFGAFMTGLFLHMVSIFEHAGLTKADVPWQAMPSAVICVTVTLLGGWVSDHIRLKYLLCTMNAGLAAVAVSLLILKPGPALWVLIVGKGVAVAMFGVLSNVTWPRFFGREHLGSINGMVFALTVFASALGPALFSFVGRSTGSYAPAAWGCLVAVAVLTPMALLANNPQRRYADRVAASPDQQSDV